MSGDIHESLLFYRKEVTSMLIAQGVYGRDLEFIKVELLASIMDILEFWEASGIFKKSSLVNLKARQYYFKFALCLYNTDGSLRKFIPFPEDARACIIACNGLLNKQTESNKGVFHLCLDE